ncbi:MAG: urea ABC transporter ATP-binding protein UrtD [Pseudooceanicola nanhaiensis]
MIGGFLKIEKLEKSFGGNKVINGFSLDVTERTLQCLVGPNGAGKTTIIDLISGRQKPDSGHVWLSGDDITGMGEHEIARRGIGRKFQIPAVLKGLTVRENLEVAYSREVNAVRNMFSFRPKGCQETLREVAGQVRLTERMDMEAGLLSHGETQWLEIGMVLMQNPNILLLDEPVAGMTENEIELTVAILNKLKRTHTIILVEHDMNFVRKIADIVTVLHMGSLLAQGSIGEIEQDERVRAVYLGTEDAH